MKVLEKRKQEILQLLESENVLQVNELAERLSVTPQTIRTDIRELNEQRLIKRFHGGVALLGNTLNDPYAERRIQDLVSKQQIGSTVAKIIPNNTSIFMNVGTTTEEVGLSLANHKGIKIVTNNLNIAHMCAKYDGCSVLVTPGEVRDDYAILGYSTQQYLEQFTLDFAIIGTSGIDEEGNLLDYDIREVSSARKIIDNSQHTILVTDTSKFGRRAMVKVGLLSNIDTIVLEKYPEKKWVDVLEKFDVDIITAESFSDT